MSSDKIRMVEDKHSKKEVHDFSDNIQGEEYEYRKSMKSSFEVKHRIEALGDYRPPSVISNLSPNQLVILSGAMSGFLAGIIVCPLDVVKTRAQAEGASGVHQSNGILGFAKAFKTIVREEGVAGLYRGVVPITIGYLPTWTIYFAVYEKAKFFYPHFYEKYFGFNVNSFNHFCSAITAGMASSIAVNPIWVVKTRLMIQKNQDKKQIASTGVKKTYYNGTIDAFKKMYMEEGFGVFYSGLIPSLFGLLHVGIHFPVYEYLKDVLKCNINDKDKKPEGALLKLIIASTVSKMTASTITYPHEILRTRLQMQHTITENNVVRNLTLKEIIQNIYTKEGFKGFYAGYGINLVRTLPASAVTLVSFEYFKTYLLEINGHKQHLAN